MSPSPSPTPPFFPPNVVSALAAALAGGVSEAVLLVGSAGRVRAVNGAACALFGVSYPPPTGQMVGQSVLEATHLRGVSEVCQSVTQSGEAVVLPSPVSLVGREAEKRVFVRAFPIAPEPGETGADVLLILEDKTELIRLQTVRTEFVANVSHELRTPLASIRATAETLLDGAMTDEPEIARRFLKTIIRESDRLVTLSEDLLELSRAESETRPRRTFDLRVLLADVAARLILQAERRQVAFAFPLAGAGVPLLMRADRSEIDQVIFNLIDNALKYTPAGGRVAVSVRVLTDKNAVEMTVADTGIGMLSHDLPRIFERFWRADRARKFQKGTGADVGGTGLGLSIVKHIIEAHEGSVRAESELGQGSRFIVVLPLLPPDETANETTNETAPEI